MFKGKRVLMALAITAVVGMSFLAIVSFPEDACAQTNNSNGRVVEWGNQVSSYIKPETQFTAIAAGGAHSLALKKDGTVVAWGKNSDGQATVPAGLTGVVAIAAGGAHSLALKKNGTVVAWGDKVSGKTDVPVGLAGVVGR